MQQRLTIVGASVRAAARSAVRAGYEVLAGDLFADADLCRMAQATRISDYPSGLATVVRRPQSGPWMYTGALENHPSLVESLARACPLWGNGAPVLRRVRNPLLVAEELHRHGLQAPQVALDAKRVPRDGSWLCKPRRSAGGGRIEPWTETSRCQQPSDSYFQQFIAGHACSAVYVAAAGRAALLGVTRQLIGQAWTGAGRFRYCGSIGPIALPSTAIDTLARIGDVLAREFDLVGLFGVDAIVNPAGVWPVEVNPRYTSSVEILERAVGLSAIALHADACESQALPSRVAPATARLSGKAILFAEARLEIAAPWSDQALARSTSAAPDVADIPAAGTLIEPGWPVCTVLVDGSDEQCVMAALRQRVAGVRIEAGREIGPAAKSDR